MAMKPDKDERFLENENEWDPSPDNIDCGHWAAFESLTQISLGPITAIWQESSNIDKASSQEIWQ